MNKRKKYCVILLKDKNKKWVVVECAKIIRVHAHDGYCTLFTSTGQSFDMWDSLKGITAMLNKRCLIKMAEVSRSHAVNVDYIDSFLRGEGVFLKAPYNTVSILLSEEGYHKLLKEMPNPATLAL